MFPQCEQKHGEHVGASPARVRIRETVQRGRSHPMDAGELVRLHCGVTLASHFKSRVPLDGLPRLSSAVYMCQMQAGSYICAHTSAFLTRIKPRRIPLYRPLCHHPHIAACLRFVQNERTPAGLRQCSAALRPTHAGFFPSLNSHDLSLISCDLFFGRPLPRCDEEGHSCLIHADSGPVVHGAKPVLRW